MLVESLAVSAPVWPKDGIVRSQRQRTMMGNLLCVVAGLEEI